jgi:putative transposase
MNLIKWQWQPIKKDELLAEIFDSELEVSYALIHGVEVKGERGNYRTQPV